MTRLSALRAPPSGMRAVVVAAGPLPRRPVARTVRGAALPRRTVAWTIRALRLALPGVALTIALPRTRRTVTRHADLRMRAVLPIEHLGGVAVDFVLFARLGIVAVTVGHGLRRRR